jgi:NAD(P)-dependent dehydrogenase (short-subunit alcohol dehydrogenase family)
MYWSENHRGVVATGVAHGIGLEIARHAAAAGRLHDSCGFGVEATGEKDSCEGLDLAKGTVP